MLNFGDFIWLLWIVVDLELSHSIGVLWILAVSLSLLWHMNDI